MKSIDIESSNIKSIYYDEVGKEMYIFFKKRNNLYIYNSDDKEYNSFLISKDKDKFFNERIKNKPYKEKF